MKTPFGVECKFFYGDYYRGRNFEECRALASAEDGRNWTSKLCKKCPVPAITRNNSCENMVLTTSVGKVWFKDAIQVKAYCTKSHESVKDPNVGCSVCHQTDFNI